MNAIRISACLLLSLASLPAHAFGLGDMLPNISIGGGSGSSSKTIDVGSIAKSLKGTQEIDEKREVEIGEGVASELLGAAPLVRNDALQKYVNDAGRWLALQTERPDLAWHFGVLDNENVNAFATPGGYVFITHGLFKKLRSETELAGVLAHEISHVLKKHHLNAIRKGAWAGLASEGLKIYMQDSHSREGLNKLIDGFKEIYIRGLDKDDEFEADRMGVVIAACAGYDPYGLPAVLQTLDSMNPQDSSLALLFKTHPAPSARLDMLDKAMQGSLDKYSGQAVALSRFDKVLSGKENGKHRK